MCVSVGSNGPVGLQNKSLCVRVFMCAYSQLRERECVCTLSIKHDCTFTISRGVLCVVCMRTILPATVHSRIALEEIVWLLCFGSGMHVHLSSLRVCVRVLACTRRFELVVHLQEKDAMCACAYVSVFEYDQHDWKKSPGPHFGVCVAKSMHGGDLLCICSSNRLV
jgi:hypothetical protein